jgi:hypothetical protein
MSSSNSWRHTLVIPKDNHGRSGTAEGKLGRALAGENMFYSFWVKIRPLETIVYISRFWIIFEQSQNCMQITATTCRSIFHAAKSAQMPYNAKIKKINNFNKKVKDPLELRLAMDIQGQLRAIKGHSGKARGPEGQLRDS